MKKVILISDLIKQPFDEGAKVVAKSLYDDLRETSTCDLVTTHGLTFLPAVFRVLCCEKGSCIIYFPSQSVTFNTFLRAKLINLISRKKVVLLSTQPREYTTIEKIIIRLIQPHKIMVQSESFRNELINIGLKRVCLNTWGVDVNKFLPVNQDKKNSLREKYNIPIAKKVYLHFGHLNKDRNLDDLGTVVRADQNNYVLVVCSTTTPQKRELRDSLSKQGFNFITEYIENNQEFYQLSDYYVFPTINRASAIEFPLSVFEALSCGIPVYCKSFGYLKDLLKMNYSNIKEYNHPRELLHDTFSLDNPVPIRNYSWDNVVKNLLAQVEE